jgi:hypothetical protein
VIVRVGDARQVLDQRAQRIAVRRDDHRLAAAQRRQNRAFPIRQHARDVSLRLSVAGIAMPA